MIFVKYSCYICKKIDEMHRKRQFLHRNRRRVERLQRSLQALAMHAITQYLHDHIEVPSQTTQLAADDQIALPHAPQQCA